MMQMDFYVISYLCTCIIVSKRKGSEKANCGENETWYHHPSSVTIISALRCYTDTNVWALLPRGICCGTCSSVQAWLRQLTASEVLIFRALGSGLLCMALPEPLLRHQQSPPCSVNTVGSGAQSAALSPATARGSQGVSLQAPPQPPPPHLPSFLFSPIPSLSFFSSSFSLCVELILL